MYLQRLLNTLQGGFPFCIILAKALPDEVMEGEAQFAGVKSVTVDKLNPFTLSGIVPGKLQQI